MVDEAHTEQTDRTEARRRLRTVLALGTVSASLLIVHLLTASASHAPPAEPVEPAAQARFSHTLAQHARLQCLMCHRRESNSPRLRLPGHSSCAGCHAQEFRNPAAAMCSICHTNPQAGAVKRFPGLKTFNVRFDHARHLRGRAAPRDGCAACHKPERGGVALSIPSGTSAHATCFSCHTPRASSGGRDLSSCGVCHRVGRYSPTPEMSRAFRLNFSHAEHETKGLACNDCHRVLAGRPKGRQVTSPYPAQHHAPARTTSCATCHDNRRAFGGDDFSDCARCHEGDTWQFSRLNRMGEQS